MKFRSAFIPSSCALAIALALLLLTTLCPCYVSADVISLRESDGSWLQALAGAPKSKAATTTTTPVKKKILVVFWFKRKCKYCEELSNVIEEIAEKVEGDESLEKDIVVAEIDTTMNDVLLSEDAYNIRKTPMVTVFRTPIADVRDAMLATYNHAPDDLPRTADHYMGWILAQRDSWLSHEDQTSKPRKRRRVNRDL